MRSTYTEGKHGRIKSEGSLLVDNLEQQVPMGHKVNRECIVRVMTWDSHQPLHMKKGEKERKQRTERGWRGLAHVPMF